MSQMLWSSRNTCASCIISGVFPLWSSKWINFLRMPLVLETQGGFVMTQISWFHLISEIACLLKFLSKIQSSARFFKDFFGTKMSTQFFVATTKMGARGSIAAVRLSVPLFNGSSYARCPWRNSEVGWYSTHHCSHEQLSPGATGTVGGFCEDGRVGDFLAWKVWWEWQFSKDPKASLSDVMACLHGSW